MDGYLIICRLMTMIENRDQDVDGYAARIKLIEI